MQIKQEGLIVVDSLGRTLLDRSVRELRRHMAAHHRRVLRSDGRLLGLRSGQLSGQHSLDDPLLPAHLLAVETRVEVSVPGHLSRDPHVRLAGVPSR